MQPSWSEFLLSAQGRVSRSQFWLRWVVPYLVVTIVLFLIVGLIFDQITAAIIMGIYYLAALWPTICIYIKRAHDRGRSGAFVLLFLVPVLNLWPLVELLFLPGTSGSNTYGSDPLALAVA
ncbi:MAG TPA: DUF805 domain-containing protein [Stellaceae bacterium]|nr:DUF805 domain-containing protein [Stellaceae bacterium]